MKPKSVEYGRVVNLGNYENMRLSVTIELEDGDAAGDGFREAYARVHEQLDAVQAAEKAREKAERRLYEPWKVTPDMVAEAPSLVEKASAAAEARAYHDNDERRQKAHDRALEFFGVDVPFKLDDDGKCRGSIEGLELVDEGWSQFDVAVPPDYLGKGQPAVLTVLQRVNSLEDLGTRFAKIRRGSDERDLPF